MTTRLRIKFLSFFRHIYIYYNEEIKLLGGDLYEDIYKAIQIY